MSRRFYQPLIAVLLLGVLTGCPSFETTQETVGGAWDSSAGFTTRKFEETKTLLGFGKPMAERGGDGLSVNSMEAKVGPSDDGCGLIKHTETANGHDYEPDVDASARIMVFSSNRFGETYDIYRMAINKAQGSLITRETNHPADDINPSISPGGKYLAFSSNREGHFGIYVKQIGVNGGEMPIAQSKFDCLHPSWSPDGEFIVYHRENSATGYREIWAKHLRTGKDCFLTYGLAPKWSPTGKAIAYQQFKERDTRWSELWICQVDADSKTGDVAVSYPSQVVASNSWGAVNPVWAPDGNWIAFASVNKSKAAIKGFRFFAGDDIYMIRVDGTLLTQLTRDVASDATPCWGSDGRVYFISDRETGHFNIFSMRPMINSIMRQPVGNPLETMLPSASGKDAE